MHCWLRRSLAILIGVTLSLFFFLTDGMASAPGSYYVDALSGSDALGDGSQARPWRTVTYAVAHSLASSTIQVKPGVYDSTLGESFPIIFTPGLRIVGAGPDKTAFVGVSDQSVITIVGGPTAITTDTLLSGVTVRAGDIGLSVRAAPGQNVSPSIVNVRAERNRVGISLSTGDDRWGGATVAPLLVGVEVLSNTQTGIALVAGSSGNQMLVAPTIIGSLVQGNGEDGISLYAVSPGNTYCGTAPHIIDTHVIHNGGHGIHTWADGYGSSQPHIERSWISDNGGYGFYWGGSPAYTLDAVIDNTVIQRNAGGGLYIGYSHYGDGTVKVVNSTVTDNLNYGAYSTGSGPLLTLVNAIVWNPGSVELGAVGSVSYSDIRGWPLAGQNGNFSSDPLVLADGHLSACSPAMNAGGLVAGVTPAEDIDDDVRPLGGQVDVGADEYEAPCLLAVGQRVSASRARWGDLVAYTVTLTNTGVLTPVLARVTDTMPALAPVHGTESATLGIIVADGHTLSWSGLITPGMVVTLNWQSRVQLANTTLWHELTADAGSLGVYLIHAVSTTVAPVQVYLPLCYYNYCPGFTDDFSSPISGWAVVDNSYLKTEYRGGEYRLLSKQANYLFLVTAPSCQLQNYTVEADIHWEVTTNNGYGLVYAAEPNFGRYDVLELNTQSRSYRAYRYWGGGYTEILPWTYSTVIRTGTAVNHVKITRTGAQMQLIINGNSMMTTYEDQITGLTHGGVAVITYPGLPLADARFDNYWFTRIDSSYALQQPTLKADPASGSDGETLYLVQPHSLLPFNPPSREQ